MKKYKLGLLLVDRLRGKIVPCVPIYPIGRDLDLALEVALTRKIDSVINAQIIEAIERRIKSGRTVTFRGLDR